MIKILFFLTFVFVPTLAVFPHGSCVATECSGSPYSLSWSSIDDVNGKFCFKLIDNNVSSPCASRFRNVTNKIIVKSSPLCKDAFVKVDINDKMKTGGVYFTLYSGGSEAELVITSMYYNSSQITNLTFCIVAKAPCNTLESFCGGMPCMFSVYDPYTRSCCPACSTTNTTCKPLFPMSVSLPFYYNNLTCSCQCVPVP